MGRAAARLRLVRKVAGAYTSLNSGKHEVLPEPVLDPMHQADPDEVQVDAELVSLRFGQRIVYVLQFVPTIAPSAAQRIITRLPTA